jgi:hypothetical protein
MISNFILVINIIKNNSRTVLNCHLTGMFLVFKALEKVIVERLVNIDNMTLVDLKSFAYS